MNTSPVSPSRRSVSVAPASGSEDEAMGEIPHIPRMPADGNGPTMVWAPQRFSIGTGCIVGLGLLACLVVAAYWGWTGMLKKASSAAAQAAGQSVVNAVGNFDADYGRLPLPPGVRSGVDFDSETTGAAGLISVLKGVDLTQNPKETDYLGEFKEAKTLHGERIVDGIYREREDVIALFDRWGLPYRIRVDGDKDGRVNDPAIPGAVLHKRILVWSAGRDGDFTTWDDNVASWQR